jgi:hypothetical protein
MASRPPHRRRLLRDLPLAYRLVAVSALFAAVVAYWMHGFTASRAVKEAHVGESDEQKYAGTIVLPTDRRDTCQFLSLDNRTGLLREKGYGPCEVTSYDLKTDPDQRRLIEIGKAFRHKSD